MDHVLRYQDTPGVKMIVVLGEVRKPSYSTCSCIQIKFPSVIWSLNKSFCHMHKCNTSVHLFFDGRLEEPRSIRFVRALKRAESPNLWCAGASVPVPPFSHLRWVSLSNNNGFVAYNFKLNEISVPTLQGTISLNLSFFTLVKCSSFYDNHF